MNDDGWIIATIFAQERDLEKTSQNSERREEIALKHHHRIFQPKFWDKRWLSSNRLQRLQRFQDNHRPTIPENNDCIDPFLVAHT